MRWSRLLAACAECIFIHIIITYIQGATFDPRVFPPQKHGPNPVKLQAISEADLGANQPHPAFEFTVLSGQRHVVVPSPA